MRIVRCLFRSHYPKLLGTLQLLALFASAAFLCPQSAVGQQPALRKLTLAQVEQLVSNDVPDSTMHVAIESRGLAFAATPAILDSLRAKGAGPLTLAAVEEFSAKPSPVDATARTQPTPSRPQPTIASTGSPKVRVESQESASSTSQTSTVRYIKVLPNSPVDHEDKPLATNDLGLLHVVLQSINKVTTANQPSSIHVTLVFTSRDNQNPMGIAVNGENANRFVADFEPLRAHVMDDRGDVWNLLPSGLRGMGFVRVGVHGRNGLEAYAPMEVGRLLRLSDDLGRYNDDPSDGYYANADSCGNGGCNMTFDSRYGNTSPQKFFPYTGNKFLSGYTTTLGVWQSLTVTMNFVPQPGASDNGQLGSFKFQCEIVVGTVGPDGKRDYQLHNLTFDMSSQPAN